MSVGWTIEPSAFSACTGHMVEDLFVRQTSDKGSLWEWSREQGVPDRVDVVTLSFGGNDIGFADIVMNCLIVQFPDWKSVVAGPSPTAGAAASTIANTITNCDASESELVARVNALLDPPIQGCQGGRGTVHAVAGENPYECDLLIASDQGNASQVRGSIADFYRYIVDEYLTDKGKLIVVGYPALFAPTGEWSNWNWLACKGVTKGDAKKLTAAATELDRILRAAVERADDGEGRILYLSNFNLYRGGAHELCGTGSDWLNGPTFELPLDFTDSFHPNAQGHQGTATRLATIANNITWPHIELRTGGLGPVGFGSSGQEAINYVTAIVGDPDSNTRYDLFPFADPWMGNDYGDFYAYGDDPEFAYRSFVTPYLRETCWRNELCLILGSETGQKWDFLGWRYYVSQYENEGNQPDLGARTAEGLHPGSTLGELMERYPGLEVFGPIEEEEYEITLPGWERTSAIFYADLEEWYDSTTVPISFFDPSIRLSALLAGVQVSIDIG